MNVLIIPCYIKRNWDLECLGRLLGSVKQQTLPFEQVYLVDDASPLSYPVEFDFVQQVKLTDNGGPARARNAGIQAALEQGPSSYSSPITTASWTGRGMST